MRRREIEDWRFVRLRRMYNAYNDEEFKCTLRTFGDKP